MTISIALWAGMAAADLEHAEMSHWHAQQQIIRQGLLALCWSSAQVDHVLSYFDYIKYYSDLLWLLQLLGQRNHKRTSINSQGLSSIHDSDVHVYSLALLQLECR